MELNDKEMNNVKGGAVSWPIVAAVGGVVAFIIGVISGYTNPTKCNN